MKRKILWILLPILAVGAIALAIVLLRDGKTGEQTQLPVPTPVLEPAESASPLPTPPPPVTAPPATPLPTASEKPAETPEPTEETKFEVSTGGQTGPTETPTPEPDTGSEPTPTATQTPVIPGRDEDELPMVP